MKPAVGKYALSDYCDWCGRKPAQSYVIEKRGVKTKRMAIEVTACRSCALRLQIADEGK